MSANDSELRLSLATVERIRTGATKSGCSQAEFVERAIAFYVEQLSDDFPTRVDAAKVALLDDDALAKFMAE